MGHEIGAHPRGTRQSRQGNQRESRALDRPESKDDDTSGGYGNRALIRLDRDHAPGVPRAIGHEPDHMATRYDHQTLLDVIRGGLALRDTRRFDEQGHAAELIEREEARAGRARLDGKGCLQLE